MPDEVIAAIIALAGVILSVGISLMVSLLTRRYNYNQLFAETVSKNRMEWINVWRESVSTFLAIAEVLHKCKVVGTSVSTESANKANCNTCDICELKKEMLKARETITTRLNMTEELHCLMFAAIKGLDYSSKNTEFPAQCEYIEELTRQILKPEWERVKTEARGKNQKKEN